MSTTLSATTKSTPSTQTSAIVPTEAVTNTIQPSLPPSTKEFTTTVKPPVPSSTKQFPGTTQPTLTSSTTESPVPTEPPVPSSTKEESKTTGPPVTSSSTEVPSPTKPVVTSSTQEVPTPSQPFTSTIGTPGTTTASPPVPSSTKELPGTTQPTLTSSTTESPIQTQPSVSSSTQEVPPSTTPFGTSSTKEVLATTQPSLTSKSSTATPAAKCTPECKYTSWISSFYPDFKSTGDFETIANIKQKGYAICQSPREIQCRAVELPDVELSEIGQIVTCNLNEGLICKNNDQTGDVKLCYDYEVRFLCCEGCEKETMSTTLSATTKSTPSTQTSAIVPTEAVTKTIQPPLPPSTKEFTTTIKPPVPSSTKQFPGTTQPTLTSSTTESPVPTEPPVPSSTKEESKTTGPPVTSSSTEVPSPTVPVVTSSTQELPTPSQPFTSSIGTPGTTAASPPVPSSTKELPGTTQPTLTSSTTESPIQTQPSVSSSTQEVPPSTAPFGTSSTKEVLATTQPSFTSKSSTATPAAKCTPECKYTSWISSFYPDFKSTGDFETIANIKQKGYAICQSPREIQCRAVELPDVELSEIGQIVTCNLNEGLICKNNDQTGDVKLCYDYEVRFLCCEGCEMETMSTTLSATTKSTPSTQTSAIVPTEAVTKTIQPSLPPSTKEFTTTFKPPVPSSTKQFPGTTQPTLTSSTTESPVPTEPPVPSSTKEESKTTGPPVTSSSTEVPSPTEPVVTSSTQEVPTPSQPFTSTIGTPGTPSASPPVPSSTKELPGTTQPTLTSSTTESPVPTEPPVPSSTKEESKTTGPPVTSSSTEVPSPTEPVVTSSTQEVPTPSQPFTSTIGTPGTTAASPPVPSSTKELPGTTQPTLTSSTTESLVPTEPSVSSSTKEVSTPSGTTAAIPPVPSSTKEFTGTSQPTFTTSSTVSPVTTQPSVFSSTLEVTRHPVTTSTSQAPVPTVPTVISSTTTTCFCEVNEKKFAPGAIVYNTTDADGWCYTAVCEQNCEITKSVTECHLTTSPPQKITSARPSTTEEKAQTSQKPTTAAPLTTPSMNCDSLNPPRKFDETWQVDKCTTATCKGGSVISLNPVNCKPAEPVVCENGRPPVKVYDDSGCCFHYECECFCSGWDNSHYTTFDGTYYNFKRSCSYVLVKEITSKNGEFKVILNNQNCDDSSSQDCAGSLTVLYKAQKVTLDQQDGKNKVFFNEVEVGIPFTNDVFTITGTQSEVDVKIAEIDATITYTRNTFSILLPYSDFNQNTEGLCGTCDNNKENDARLPDGTTDPSFTRMPDQWLLPTESKPECTNQPKPTPTPTSQTTQPTCKAEVCDILNSKVFEDCQKVIPVEIYYTACQNDVCSNPEKHFGCSSLEAYASKCLSSGICVDWRGATNGKCEFNCPETKEYKACGPAMEPTCNAMYNEKYKADLESSALKEGCYCPEKKTLFSSNSDICVSTCGCTGPDGMPKEAGDTWESNCNECICNQNSLSIQCKKKTCEDEPPVVCTEAGQTLVSEEDGSCCAKKKCVCDISLCKPVEHCKPGYEETVTTSPTECCPTVVCHAKDVCVYNNVEFQPGASIVKDKCEECKCTADVDPETKLHVINCEKKPCNTNCEPGFVYTDVEGECCGHCVQESCVVSIKGEEPHTVKLGETWSVPGDYCNNYQCLQYFDEFILLQERIACSEKSTSDCSPGSEFEKVEGQCCGRCVEKSCVIVTEDNTPHLLQPGEIWPSTDDKCTSYTCSKQSDHLITVETKMQCEDIDVDDCIPGTLTVDSSGCCKHCTKKPKTCQMKTETIEITHNGCKSPSPVTVNSCEGPCGSSSMYSADSNSMTHTCSCCQEKKTSEKQIQLVCPGGKKLDYSYVYVEECGCNDKVCLEWGDKVDKGKENSGSEGDSKSKESNENRGSHERKGSNENRGSHERKGSNENRGSHERKGSNENRGSHERKGSNENRGSFENKKQNDSKNDLKSKGVKMASKKMRK
ncbi:mucin-2-like isoform X2 [Polypterus senegalus]|uniref:mucin-2-like isoform X2 n=1 Tax=Polypterus senegalus TaxID=55291 RepID=UPI0019640327|nr:mucin-2-like isoform X2 [Polypterus senegalus]